jgi:hypothetical protein
VQRPGDVLQRHHDPTNVKLLEREPMKMQEDVDKAHLIDENAFKETDQDVISLQKMIKEEGLEHVEEKRLE